MVMIRAFRRCFFHSIYWFLLFILSSNSTKIWLSKESTFATVCDHIRNPAELLTRSRTIAGASEQNIVALTEKTIGPTLTVGIVTYASSNIWSYAAYSFAINLAYAEHNGYAIQLLDEDSIADFAESDSRWNKIKILERGLDPKNGWARNFDFIVWMDADLVMLDFSFRIESLLQSTKRSQASIFVSAEHAGSSTLINSGCLVVRNTLWARRFLSEWWEHADRTLFSDQEQFDLLYEHKRRLSQPDEWRFTDNIVILPPDKLNSDPPAMTMQKAHNEVLHLMGEQTDYRIKVFRSGLEEICQHLRALQPTSSSTATAAAEEEALFVLAPQLGLTQANLLRWAGEVYKSESAALLREYEAVLPSHGSSRVSTPQGLEASRNLANSVHHYAYALTHSSAVAGGESGSGGAAGARYRTAITARKKVYQLLRRNLVAWKKLKQPAVAAVGTSRAGSNRNTFVSPRSVDVGVGVGVTLTFEDIRQDWPELLKVTCTAGQHLLSISDRAVLSPEERRHVAGEILLMTQEMMGESHPSQHNSILLMVADIHQQIGVMDLQESQHLTDLANTASGGGAAEGDAAVGAGAEGDAVVGDLTENNGNPASARELIISALQHFQLSLDVNTQIAEKTGAHILVSPLILTANALASLEQFDQAFEHYRRAVALNERHLGAQHNSNLPLLVDFGISLVHASHCEEAVRVIDRALELIALNNVPTDSVENRRATLYKQKIAIKCEF